MEFSGRERTFQYDAFICYSHKDSALARRLQESLEARYRRLEKKIKGSRPVLRICRDETDLTSAPSLWSAIEEKIRISRMLIVICSPHARGSSWVDREIRAFREIHPTSDQGIIQVVLDGKDPVEESAFPPALLRSGDVPLAIDLRREKFPSPWSFGRYLRNEGALRVLAPLLGENYSRLSDRQGAYERRRRWRQIAAALVLVLALVAAALIARARWQRTPPHVVSREITGTILQSLETDPVAVLRRAIEAAEARPTPETEQALRSAVQSSAERRFLRHEPAWARGSYLSQDGQRLLLFHQGTASVRDFLSGRTFSFETGGDDDAVLDAGVSADGRYVVTVSRIAPIRVWEVPTGRVVATAPRLQFSKIQLAGQARHILITSHPMGGDPAAYLWTWAGSRPPRNLREGSERVDVAALSGNGERVITKDQNGVIRIWNAETGRRIAVLRGEPETRYTDLVALDVEGRRALTSSWGRAPFVWNIDDERRIASLEGHAATVSHAVFSPDGRILTSSDDQTARVWDASTGYELAVLRGHTDLVQEAAFSHDGRRVVTASRDRTARVWDLMQGKELAILLGHEDEVEHVGFTANGLVATESSDGTARLWAPRTGFEVAILEGLPEVRRAEISADARLVLAMGGGMGGIWEAATGRRLAQLGGPGHPLTFAAFDPGGQRVVTSSADGTAYVWDARTGRRLAFLQGHGGKVSHAAFSPDGRRVVTAGADATARIWDAGSGRELAVLRGHSSEIHQASFSPDGRRILTGSEDETVRLWDAATRRTLTTLRIEHDPIVVARFSRDGQRIIAEGESFAVRVWDAETGGVLLEQPGFYPDEFNARGLSDDGSREVVSMEGDEHVLLAMVGKEGKQIARLEGHRREIWSAELDREGRRAVTAGEDSFARVWDAENGRLLSILGGHEGPLRLAIFSPDGRLILTAEQSGTMRLFYSRLEDLLSLARARLTR